jgi:hypothetical protein
VAKYEVEYTFNGRGSMIVEADSEEAAQRIVDNIAIQDLKTDRFDWEIDAYEVAG